MIIQITAPGAYVCDDANGPEVGHKYRLEASEGGSSEQGRAFHDCYKSIGNQALAAIQRKALKSLRIR